MGYGIGLLFAFLCMISYGSYVIVLKGAIRKLGTYSSASYLRLFSAAIVILFSIFFVDFKPISMNALMSFFLSITIGSGVLFVFYHALKKGDVSVVMPISQTSSAFSVILAFIILRETVPAVKYLFISLILIGILLVSTDFEHLKRLNKNMIKKGSGFALLAALMWGVWAVVSKSFVNSMGGINSIPYLELGITFCIMVPFFIKPKILKKPDKKSLKLIIWSALIFSVAALTFYPALQYLPIAIVSPITASSPLITLLLARVFLKEKISLNQIIGAFIIVIGLVLLTL